MDEGRATAILSLQSEACLEALGIDYPALHARACARGLLAARVAVRDFDHDDQAAMLPEAVRALHTLLALGHRVYVHCTAGINRATLTTVGYLTFVQGVGLEEALRAVKQARPQAHPYVDCWRTVRRRLVEGRGDEVGYEARAIFDRRREQGRGGSSSADWAAAEEVLIRRTFQRQVAATLSIVKSMQARAEARRTLESILHAEEEVIKLRAALEALTESAQLLLSGEGAISNLGI